MHRFPMLGESGEVVSCTAAHIGGRDAEPVLARPAGGIFNRHSAKAREVILVEALSMRWR